MDATTFKKQKKAYNISEKQLGLKGFSNIIKHLKNYK